MFKKKNKKNVTPEMIEKVILVNTEVAENKTVDCFMERLQVYKDAVNHSDASEECKEQMMQAVPYLSAMITAEVVSLHIMKHTLIDLLCDEPEKAEKLQENQ